ncbi:AraC family transcriptional regulator (plasmid) [Piscirickettsia salmonis]|uniref:AraC family transcriptional regulator n=1 Tax=Piscirickettsia salmonis TaxID=1238 RepID=A0AAC8VLS1_PISSA|nr:AraC family transcriptional regulator [Piscirickettsia salmonis]
MPPVIKRGNNEHRLLLCTLQSYEWRDYRLIHQRSAAGISIPGPGNPTEINIDTSELPTPWITITESQWLNIINSRANTSLTMIKLH